MLCESSCYEQEAQDEPVEEAQLEHEHIGDELKWRTISKYDIFDNYMPTCSRILEWETCAMCWCYIHNHVKWNGDLVKRMPL